MIRPLTLVSLILAAGSAGFLFVEAHQAQRRERELDRLSRAIQEQREAVIVLEAEWAYLNRLERLQQLAGRHLDLAPVTPDRVVRVQDLPVRPPSEGAPGPGRAAPQAPSRQGERGR